MSGTLAATGLTTGHAPFVEEARSRGELYISQAYDLYSEENHEAWRRLFARIQPQWERYANPHFLHGVDALQLPHDRIPRLSEINRRLQPLTGFQAKAGQRLRPRLPLLRLPAPPRVSHHHHHPSARPHGLPAGARHLPRRRRPRPHAHRPAVRRHPGTLRRMRRTPPREITAGIRDYAGARPPPDQHHARHVALLLVYRGVRPDARTRTASAPMAAAC